MNIFSTYDQLFEFIYKKQANDIVQPLQEPMGFKTYHNIFSSYNAQQRC